MGLQEDLDEDVTEKFEELCLSLNLDNKSKNEAWSSYERIRLNYTLEGDAIHWLACSLYVACRKLVMPTVGRGVIEGNGVSLTRLLRSANFTLLQFFNKMKKWADMANLPKEFREKVDRLERNFAVSTVIFKKFEPIFLDLFKDPQSEPVRVKSRKQSRRLPCNSSDLFGFCWTLFVYVKGNFPAISDDLVNSYHLLLCCIDWIYSNVFLSNRKDLLNPNFTAPHDRTGDAAASAAATSPAATDAPCLIQHLCEKHDGLVLEAKGIKEHWWRPHIKRLFEKKVLKGKLETLSGILETTNFDPSRRIIDRVYQELVDERSQIDERIYTCRRSKAVNNEYDSFVLNVGDFDERIFITGDPNGDIGQSQRSPLATSAELTERMKAKKSLSQQIDEPRSLTPVTPLTGRRYLPKEQETPVTPVSTATQSVSRLHSLLSGRQTLPSQRLVEIFRLCKNSPLEEVRKRVLEMGDKFCEKYAEKGDKSTDARVDFARRRLQLGESLYYKALEDVLMAEQRRFDTHCGEKTAEKASPDFSTLLDQDMFHRSLFACCLEIVMYAYNSQRTFPWIVEVFSLDSYHFYKVIEILIRAEDGLSRDVVKHLNLIEETILEQLAWRSESPLWKAIDQHGKEIPTCEEVMLPQQIDSVAAESTVPTYHAVHRFGATSTSSHRVMAKDILGSPGGSASEVFVASPAPGSAKRNLFGTNVRVARGDVVTNQALTSRAEDAKNAPVKPAKTGSLALFFRKVYHLASVRLRDMCDRLDVDVDTRAEMWTCFEHTLVKHVWLMEDRHLDQLLMCAIYVIAKVSGKDRSFQDIMKCYRLQPQSQSHVYRSVLLTSRRRRTSGESSASSRDSTSPPPPPDGPKSTDKRHIEKLIRSPSTLPDPRPCSQPPTPTRLAGTASSFDDEDRGDLIRFYNAVYVKKVKLFALKFSVSSKANGSEPPPLSPLPHVRPHPSSPRRVSQNHSIYVSPHKPTSRPTASTTALSVQQQMKLSYCFNRSPAKDLRAINSMVRLSDRVSSSGGGATIGKRLLRDAEQAGDSPVKKQALEMPGKGASLVMRLNEVIIDRQDASGAT